MPEKTAPKPLGSAILTMLGLLAAFGAASCCALPVVLASLGLGSAWLLGVAIFAGPNRTLLIYLAIGLLVLAVVLLVQRQNRIACQPPSRTTRVVTTLIVAGLLAVAVLAGLAVAVR